MTDPTKAKCLTDQNWKFYKDTNLKRTFDRIRREQKQAQAKPANVTTLKTKRTAT